MYNTLLCAIATHTTPITPQAPTNAHTVLYISEDLGGYIHRYKDMTVSSNIHNWPNPVELRQIFYQPQTELPLLAVERQERCRCKLLHTLQYTIIEIQMTWWVRVPI